MLGIKFDRKTKNSKKGGTPLKKKLLKTASVLALSLSLAGCATFRLPTPTPTIYDSGRDRLAYVAGVVTSVGVHWTGHALQAQASGLEWQQEGLREQVESSASAAEMRRFLRAGFLAQLSVGLLAKLNGQDSPFWTGYYHATFAEVVGYPVFWKDSGDYHNLSRNGANKEKEYVAYSTLALFLLTKSPTSISLELPDQNNVTNHPNFQPTSSLKASIDTKILSQINQVNQLQEVTP
jgi:hypothetical protein